MEKIQYKCLIRILTECNVCQACTDCTKSIQSLLLAQSDSIYSDDDKFNIRAAEIND